MPAYRLPTLIIPINRLLASMPTALTDWIAPNVRASANDSTIGAINVCKKPRKNVTAEIMKISNATPRRDAITRSRKSAVQEPSAWSRRPGFIRSRTTNTANTANRNVPISIANTVSTFVALRSSPARNGENRNFDDSAS